MNAANTIELWRSWSLVQIAIVLGTSLIFAYYITSVLMSWRVQGLKPAEHAARKLLVRISVIAAIFAGSVGVWSTDFASGLLGKISTTQPQTESIAESVYPHHATMTVSETRGADAPAISAAPPVDHDMETSLEPLKAIVFAKYQDARRVLVRLVGDCVEDERWRDDLITKLLKSYITDAQNARSVSPGDYEKVHKGGAAPLAAFLANLPPGALHPTEAAAASLALAFLMGDPSLGLSSFNLLDPVSSNDLQVVRHGAHLALATGNFDLAETCYRRSAAIAPASERLVWSLYSKSGIARAAMSLNQVDRAEALWKEVLGMTGAAGRPEMRADFEDGMGRVWLARGKVLEAQPHLRAALTVERELKSKQGIADQAISLAGILVGLGQLEEAESLYRESEQIERELGSSAHLGDALAGLGIALLARGNFAAGETALADSIPLESTLGRKERLANRYDALGECQLRQNKFALAQQNLVKAIAMNEELGKKDQTAIQYGKLGLAFHRLGNDDRAEIAYMKAKDINESLGRNDGLARNFADLAMIYLKNSRLADAERMLLAAVPLNEKLGQIEPMAVNLEHLGMIQISRERMELAQQYFQRARDLYVRAGLADRAMQIDRRMSGRL